MIPVLWVLGGLVYAGVILLMLAVNHGGHTGPHPRPEAPSIGEDLSDDEPDEKQHVAWLDGEPPASGA